MAYFITASTSASVTQTTFDTTGSIVTSSLFTPNDPLNVDNITTIKKSRSQYPSLNRPIYKESVSFTNCDGTNINWLYDTTASRDSDFNIIKALNTNYNPVASSPAGKATNIQYNGGGYFDSSNNFVFISSTNTLEITGSLKIAQGVSAGIVDLTGASAVSGSIFSGSFIGDGSGLTGLAGDGSNITNLQRPVSLSVSSHMTASNDNAGFFFEVGAVTCSIQTSSLVACNIGSEFEFFQSSSGHFIFVTGSGVTLRSKGGALTLTGQYSAATLKKIRAEEWVLVGDLA